MSPPSKLAAFAVLLTVVFGGGLALGAAVGPIGDPAPTDHGPAHGH